MKFKISRMFLFIFLPAFVFVSEANLSADQPETKVRSPVYFPSLPEAFAGDFGVKVPEARSSTGPGKSLTPTKDLPPVSSPKPTTTTEKLPLAQESHVVNNSITEAPDPAYLTDTVYYYSQTTPSPGSRNGGLHHYGDAVTGNDRGLLEDRESEVDLQSVLSYKPQYIGDRIAADPLLNPALMFYIPTGSEEQSADLISVEKSTPQPPIYEPRIFFSTIYHRAGAATTEEINKTLPTRQPSRYRKPTDAPELYRPPPTTFPRGKYRARNPRPPRIHRPPQKSIPNSERVNESKVTIIDKLEDSISKGGSINSFESRISGLVVNSFHETPSNQAPRPPTPKARKPERIKIKKYKISKASLDFPKEDIPVRQEVVEIYRPPGQEDSEEFFEQHERDYKFDFDNASGSAPRRRYRPPSVTTAPYEEAPVYRTSTKSYRAPSPLYQVQSAKATEFSAPSHRDFVQADSNIYVPEEYKEDTIPGIGGVDYPNYFQIPGTRFSCSDQNYPGLYADREAACQVFHICQEGGREDSFLCPNGTVFNQQYFVCDWWYNFSCDQADKFYSLNAFIYELPEDRARGGRTTYN